MSAIPSGQSQPSPSNKDIFHRFAEQYEAALSDAAVAAEHTATEGWRRLYVDHRERLRQRRRALAKGLAGLARTLEDFGLGEDEEKAIREIAKESAALREADDIFVRETIGPVRAPVEACQRIILEFVNEAVREESAGPLVNVGMADLMKMRAAQRPKPVWNIEPGTVTINPPERNSEE